MINASLGVDPGLKGAISVISNANTLEIFDMPVMAKPYGKGNMVSPSELSTIVRYIKDKYIINLTVIESVSAMPGQGVSSTFSFGRSLGTIEGVLSSYDCELTYITPQKWKKAFDLSGKEKDASRLKAIDLFPDYADVYFKRKKDVDRADATLIVLQGYSIVQNRNGSNS